MSRDNKHISGHIKGLKSKSSSINQSNQDLVTETNIKIIILHCVIVFILSKLVFVYEYTFITNYLTQPSELSFIARWMSSFDGLWYLDIAKHGYAVSLVQSSGQAPWNFWPFFPLLIRIVSLTGVSPEVAALLINQSALFLCMVLLYTYCEKFTRNVPGLYAVFFLSVSMENIYFLAAYTEAIFFLLSLLAFYNLHKQNFWLSSIFAAMLSATKFVGFLFVFALLIYKWRNNLLNKRTLFLTLGQVVVCLSGLLGFMLYLHLHINDALAFYHVRVYWHIMPDVLGNWIADPVGLVTSIFIHANPYELLALLLLLITVVTLYKDKLYEEAIFSIGCIAPVILEGYLWGTKRYVLVLFPVYMVLARYGSRYPIAGAFMLIIANFIQFIFCVLWLNGRWPAA